MTDMMQELGALALGSRLKRLADALMQDGVRVYQSEGVGFEPRWFPVFVYLFRKGPTSITGLARGLGVSHPGINKIANELIGEKFAAPYRDRNDKRKRVLALTSIGRDKYQELEPTWRNIRQALQTAVDEGGGDFMRQLQALEESLQARDFYDRFGDQLRTAEFNPEIRSYRPEYAKAFKDLNIAWITHYFTLEPADTRVLENPEETILAAGGELLFAVEPKDEQILGTCALIKLTETTAELAKMAVSEQAKGKQIGQQLGEAVIVKARELGFRSLCLESNRKLTPAINLYRKLGFIEKPFPHASDYSRADIYMELTLEP